MVGNGELRDLKYSDGAWHTNSRYSILLGSSSSGPDKTDNPQTASLCFVKIYMFNVGVCITYQQWMSQDQTGLLDWTGWGSARSGQRFFHSTGLAWSPESERSTASHLPHPLPWWRLLSGSKHPAGINREKTHLSNPVIVQYLKTTTRKLSLRE